MVQAVLTELPPPPAFVRLVRIRLDPGASVPLHTHPGPEFGRIESGVLTVRVEAEAVIAQASAGGTPQPPRVPPVGQEFQLGPGDQIVYPAEVPLAFSNQGQQPTTLLALVILPAGSNHPPGAQWVGGTPGPEAMTGVTSQILGDAVATGWPSGQLLLVLDRLVLAPGDTIPSRNGPVMLSVELGHFQFALLEGEFQVSSGGSGPQAIATPGVAYGLDPGEAVFFPNGMSEVPRPDQESVLVLLRFSVVGVDGEGAETTPAAGNPPAEPTAVAVAPSPESGAPTPPPASEGFAPNAAVVVTESGVRLRDTPSTAGEVVADLQPGRQLIVTGAAVEAEGIVWYPVQAADDPAVVGYISAEFLAPAQ